MGINSALSNVCRIWSRGNPHLVQQSMAVEAVTGLSQEAGDRGCDLTSPTVRGVPPYCDYQCDWKSLSGLARDATTRCPFFPSEESGVKYSDDGTVSEARLDR